ncbi:signal peptide, CUB and EGF-like domain-containing protein 2 [Amphiura filiformis]|uniref:signal peptide, CUB and EGF-like domain-containing protein 2 n=1 Tax=Amphiura filiformis TaxID=82378 RepID=UPI003B2102E1
MYGKTTIKDQKRLDALLHHTMRQKAGKTKQVKRNSPYEFTVSFDITMTFNPDPDSDLVDASWDAVDNLYYMMDELYVMAENDQLVPDVDGMEIDTRLQDGYPINYWDEEVSPECDPGYVEATGSLLCTACFLGTYNVNGGCEGCPIGTYQDEKAQIECKLCPEGMSTLRTGSQNITDCKTICHPGQYSITGLAPCTDCSVGSYQPLTRSTECILCPDGQSTVQSGCQSQDNCDDVCLPGEISSTGIVPCTACSRGSYHSLIRWRRNV